MSRSRVLALVFPLAGIACASSTLRSEVPAAAGTATAHYYVATPRAAHPDSVSADVCVYGATPAGIAAGIQVRRMGKSVVLAAFDKHVGGVTASGLGATDIGRKAGIGGISREFYRRVGARYGAPEAWVFEPHVAEEVFERMLAEAGVPIRRAQHLATVERDGARVRSITMEDGTTLSCSMYVDATYEGDLMARAGVSYTIGREANAKYGETLNGVQFGHPAHNFNVAIDPYRVPGQPSSGLLPGISAEPLAAQGAGDRRVQAYNFRLCLTKERKNWRPIPKPASYDPRQYELLARYVSAGVFDALKLSIAIPNGKTDTNNHGGFSTDFIAANYDWPDGDYATRERIYQAHLDYQMGLLWFLCHDERLPAHVREESCKWGLPNDEFPETGGWPRELYVREARRMVSDLVMTERHCRGKERVPDSIGLAAYGMDSHNTQRVVVNGAVKNEGNVEEDVQAPFPIGYHAIVPRRGEAENLLVPVALSATHIAYGSIRMEPVFMILGQSAATAAVQALDTHLAVQAIDYETLRRRLLADGQVLELSSTYAAPHEVAPGTPK
jgi:hypothetical protein